MRYVAIMAALTMVSIFVWPMVQALGKKVASKSEEKWEELDENLESKDDDEPK